MRNAVNVYQLSCSKKEFKLMKTFQTYCPNCDDEVKALLKSNKDELLIRGEKVGFDSSVLECPECHQIIADSRIEEGNLQNAYDEYRKGHGLLLPVEIKNIRKRIGLSLREFSRLLNFGEQTIARYESGSIQDFLHDNTIRLASTPEGVQRLFIQNKKNLSDRTKKKVSEYLEKNLRSSLGYRTYLAPSFFDAAAQKPTKRNGYRALDEERVQALVGILASKCHDFYVTKLQKALFFCDFLCFERLGKSLTGLEYVHGTYGPMIDRRDILIFELEGNGVIERREHDCGEIIVAKKSFLNGMPKDKEEYFTDDERSIIYEVAQFVNSFPTASQLSDYSHELNYWKTTAPGKAMNYELGEDSFKEVDHAVKARMNQIR